MEQFDVKQKIEEFRLTFLGKNWIWRKGQIEIITEIIQTYLDKKYNVIILDCPTGSGKSILAMCASWIFNQLNKKSYILASDILLQEQYEKDFKKFNLNWGSIKGIDNYICIDNMEKNSLGTCRIRNITSKNMSCYPECPYYVSRDLAAISSTALLNYAYWLIMQNYVNIRIKDPLFPPRHVTFCDEAHKLLDIIQNHYSPRFDERTLEKIEKLTQFFNTYKIKNHIPDYKNIKKYIEQLYKIENQDEIYHILLNIEHSFESYLSSISILKDKINKDYPKEDPPKEWRDALYHCDWLKDLHCKLEDFNDIIEKTSTRNIVKNPTKEKELTFNCLEESYMMHKYFHQWTGFTILMSATFSDASKYLKSLALGNAKYIKMHSNFNFDKSPIYYYNKRKMSWNKIDENLPWMFKKIDEILDNHLNESGVIHTASYDLALKIFNGLSHKNKRRILIYNGTEEKRQVVQMLKVNKNKILMGPSLIEGLDLKDDWSRFAIFAKVPYLSLSDKFVSTKLKIDPDWYRWCAAVNILQGVGRSIRNESDWAITYILDAALGDLIHYNRKMFPEEFIQRIVVME